MLDIILLVVRFEHEPSKAGLGGRAGLGFLCYAMPSPSVVDRRNTGRKPPHWMARPGSFIRSEQQYLLWCGCEPCGPSPSLPRDCTLGHLSSKFGHSVL